MFPFVWMEREGVGARACCLALGSFYATLTDCEGKEEARLSFFWGGGRGRGVFTVAILERLDGARAAGALWLGAKHYTRD